MIKKAFEQGVKLLQRIGGRAQSKALEDSLGRGSSRIEGTLGDYVSKAGQKFAEGDG